MEEAMEQFEMVADVADVEPGAHNTHVLELFEISAGISCFGR